jgi:hypothetical protein
MRKLVIAAVLALGALGLLAWWDAPWTPPDHTLYASTKKVEGEQ